MTQKNIQKIEEQRVTVSINGRMFNFRFFAFRNLMYVDISRNGEDIVLGKRVIANQWLLPNYVAEGIGNIRFDTYASDGDDYVWYDDFNVKFRLTTYTDEEVKELEGNEAGQES
jgi:hypothetical protein